MLLFLLFIAGIVGKLVLRASAIGAVVILNSLDLRQAHTRRPSGVRFEGVSTAIFYNLSQKVRIIHYYKIIANSIIAQLFFKSRLKKSKKSGYGA